jgi:chloramphenicol 3-O-phosphotransferase
MASAPVQSHRRRISRLDMKLIFLHGLPGAGKLTVARALSKLTGYGVFHNHLTVDLVQAVFEFGSPAFIELRELIWTAVFRRAADENLPGLIFTFAFEPTVTARFIETVVEIMESRGGEVLFVELRCDQKTLEERVKEPSRGEFGKLSSVEKLRDLMENGDLDTLELPRPQLVLDTPVMTPAEAAELICSHYEIFSRE